MTEPVAETFLLISLLTSVFRLCIMALLAGAGSTPQADLPGGFATQAAAQSGVPIKAEYQQGWDDSAQGTISLKETGMIALTAKAATRFGVSYFRLLPVETGAWVVDCLKLSRGPLLLLCVHQDTLYAIVRRATRIESLESLADEIERALPFIRLQRPLVRCRNSNRRVTGSITNMKGYIRYLNDLVSVGQMAEVERHLHECPFSAIGNACPKDRMEAVAGVRPTGKGNPDSLSR